jgi:hypothetical protein
MKKQILIAAFVACTCLAQAQVKMPQPSPTTNIKQDFGTGQIELTYSRPSLKGRAVFAENSPLAPVGKAWRTGANAPTLIHFTDPVTVGSAKIDSGSYVIYTVPGNSEWEVMFNKGLKNPSNEGFSAADDVVKIKVPSFTMNESLETFTMLFGDLKDESCMLYLLWGSSGVAIPIVTDVKNKVRGQIEAAMKTDKKPYWDAARFYYEYDKDYPKALDNVNSAISTTPDAFWMYLMKARIQKDMKDANGAKVSATKCIESATKAKNDEYVKMANELIKSL